ncbi:hypothetical protein D1872_252020 [compost metagenome]
MLRPIHVLRPVGRHQEVVAGPEVQKLQNVAACDFFLVMAHHFVNRIAGQHDVSARIAFGDQMAFALGRIWHIYGGDRVDHFPVLLLRHIQIKTAVPRLHMHYGKAHPFRKDGAQGAVRIAQQQHTVRLLQLQDPLHLGEHRRHLAAKRGLAVLQNVIGRTETELLKKNTAQAGRKILARMDQNMLARIPVQQGNNQA